MDCLAFPSFHEGSGSAALAKFAASAREPNIVMAMTLRYRSLFKTAHIMFASTRCGG
jgi:hypothetical protein